MAGWVLEGEPVRGGHPPPGFLSLSGAEQVRAYAHGLVPRPPFFRMFGIRVSHAAPGSATLTMPASPWHVHGPGGAVTVWPIVLLGLNLAARTMAAPGMLVFTKKFSLNFVRVATLASESFVARARVMIAGTSRITTEVHIEDASGRLVAHAVGQSVTLVADPPPPPAPELLRHEEPSYPTPDPSSRPLDRPLPTPADLSVGSSLVSRWRESVGPGVGALPLARLMGYYFRDIAEGHVESALPATEWLEAQHRTGAFAVTTPLAQIAGSAAATVLKPGRGVSVSAADVAFTGRRGGFPPLDGRELIARADVIFAGDHEIVTDAELLSPEGERVVLCRTVSSVWEAREEAAEVDEQRALATVLFMDMVESTPTVQRLGDAKWRELLEHNVALVRREIQAARGREIKTEGDGFLATFDLPAAAIRCARAVREGLRRQGLEVRAGIHLGEIELIGPDVAGLAVHVASRVESIADPGTVLVTSTVREAMAGSGTTFTSRGTHQLKGVSDEWHLYAVEE